MICLCTMQDIMFKMPLKTIQISKCFNVSVSERPPHLELVLFPGVALAPDVLLQVHVVFERLSGGREGNRGQKLNHQTTKHTHGKREGEKGKEEEEREGRGKQSFSFFHPKRAEGEKRLLEKKGFGPNFKNRSKGASPIRFSRTSGASLKGTLKRERECVCVI